MLKTLFVLSWLAMSTAFAVEPTTPTPSDAAASPQRYFGSVRVGRSAQARYFIDVPAEGDSKFASDSGSVAELGFVTLSGGAMQEVFPRTWAYAFLGLEIAGSRRANIISGSPSGYGGGAFEFPLTHLQAGGGVHFLEVLTLEVGATRPFSDAIWTDTSGVYSKRSAPQVGLLIQLGARVYGFSFEAFFRWVHWQSPQGNADAATGAAALPLRTVEPGFLSTGFQAGYTLTF
jgi:hypothetical protein